MKTWKSATPLCLLVLLSCSTEVRQNDWQQLDEPEREAFLQDEIALPRLDDPVEPYNRGVSTVNHGFIVGLLSPVATGYRLVVPPPLRKRLVNVFANLRWPVRLAGNVLQGDFGGAGRETARFLINTTVGVLGIFDPAADWGIEPADEDVGRAFAAWGWDRSSYFVLPIFGPSTVRDTCALPVDTVLDLATYLPGASLLRGLNRGSDLVEKYKSFVHTNYDPYVKGRAVFALTGELHTRAFRLVRGDDPSVETLGAVYLSYQSPDFPAAAAERTVEIESTGGELPYTLWLQPRPAPLVFVLPGLGGHRDSDSALGLAEMIYDHGLSAVTISSSMNWEFMERASSVAVPGYAPADVRDVHAALDAIALDLDVAYPGAVTGRCLLGMSLGAFHTLLIAASEKDPNNLFIKFDRYVALNPPVGLRYGMGRLDRFYNAPLELPAPEREKYILGVLSKVVDLYQRGQLDLVEKLPFTKMEAEFLIGLAFRVTLMEIIMASQNRIDLGVLMTERTDSNRTSAYREIREFSYAEYMLAFVLPYFRRLDYSIRGPEDLYDRCDLRGHQDALRDNAKVRVFTNENDFLLGPDDLTWLGETFGPERIVVAQTGGHLGNLYLPEVQEEIMSFFSDVVLAGLRRPGV